MRVLQFLKKKFDPNAREIRRLSEMVQAINALEPDCQKLSDEELRAKTEYFRERLGKGIL